MKILVSALVFVSFIATSCEKNPIKNERCELEPDPGMCQAAFPKYYYDKEEGKCKQFTWGGCGGVVPFETLEECQNGCGCDDSREDDDRKKPGSN